MLNAPALYLGRPEIWLAAFDEFAWPASLARPRLSMAGLFAARALCLASIGRLDEARTLVEPLLDEIAASAADSEIPIGMLDLLLQVAVALEHRVAAAALAARLARVAHLGHSHTYTCVARHLGDAALLAENRMTARAYYRQALEAAGKIRFRPEMALAHLRLAGLLLEDADQAGRSEALEHLDIAIPELRDMHMQPAFGVAQTLYDSHAHSLHVVPARSSVSDILTAREWEIASLMAGGLSNREIAARLVISEGTVEVHVKHVLSKLGYRSRSQVVGWFARQQA
jgi:ATP/maltotriose-dependent transcriptional regulator MalT